LKSDRIGSIWLMSSGRGAIQSRTLLKNDDE
jgi:hypothetical protein